MAGNLYQLSVMMINLLISRLNSFDHPVSRGVTLLAIQKHTVIILIEF